jgi:hypothetical protein
LKVALNTIILTLILYYNTRKFEDNQRNLYPKDNVEILNSYLGNLRFLVILKDREG